MLKRPYGWSEEVYPRGITWKRNGVRVDYTHDGANEYFWFGDEFGAAPMDVIFAFCRRVRQFRKRLPAPLTTQ